MYYLPPPPPSYTISVHQREVVQATSIQFAQANIPVSEGYGKDVYGSDVYGGSTSTKAELINTGTIVSVIITVASILILAALVVRFWKRPSKKD